MKTVLITGANRGLGLEFAKQYVEAGWRVLGTCRSPQTSGPIESVGAEVETLNVTDEASCRSLSERLEGTRISLLLNNAGIMGDKTKSALDADVDEWGLAFQTNVIGPALVTRHLLENLKAAPNAIGATLGSQAGIFANMQSDNLAIYRSTKAAAHSVTLSLANALVPFGIPYVSLRPGRTKTDMTDHEGDYEVEDSVSRLRCVLEEISMAQSGKFIDRTGETYPYG